jgi:DNA-binding NarL/FixJ family response regulator
MNEQVKILIADDHALVRKGLRQVIESDSRFKIIGEAANGKEALTLLLQQPPQIAILDVNMPELTGFEVAQALHSCKLNVAIIFLTMHNDKNYFNKAMDYGAKGYILKDGALDEIVNALEAVMHGKPYISAALSSYLLQRLDRISLLARQTPELNTLTPTERRILKLVAEYKTSKEIAEELHIHFRTVDNHRTNITNKLG